MTLGFTALDYMVMVTYILAIIGMSLFFMRRQKNTTDYFLGGRSFPWFPVAISMYVTLFSPISFIASPGRAYNYGMTMYLYSIFAVIGAILGIIIFVPFLRKLSLTTAYEYLERRFDLNIRLLASFLFLMLRVFYLGVVLFATAIALRPATGWPLLLSIVLVGVIATFYTTMGGMKTVVWSDVLQFTILFGAILWIVFMLAGSHPEGFIGIWNNAKSQGRTFNRLAEGGFYHFNPFITTFWGIFLFSVFTKLGYAAADQSCIQRYLSTRKARDASKSFLWGTILSIPVQFLLYFTGLGLFYYYGANPSKALTGMPGDQALPHFIATELPPGVTGLIMAAILAAVMSTVDSVLNSLSACTVTDFYRRVFRPHKTEKHYLRVAMIATVVWGFVAIMSAIAIINLYGTDLKKNPLMTVSNATIGFFIGILLALFLLGILTRRSNPAGVFAPKLSFTWIAIIGCSVTFAVGYAVSLFTPLPVSEKINGFIYWDLRKQKSEDS